jgi:hypothetical protein
VPLAGKKRIMSIKYLGIPHKTFFKRSDVDVMSPGAMTQCTRAVSTRYDFKMLAVILQISGASSACSCEFTDSGLLINGF